MSPEYVHSFVAKQEQMRLDTILHSTNQVTMRAKEKSLHPDTFCFSALETKCWTSPFRKQNNFTLGVGLNRFGPTPGTREVLKLLRCECPKKALQIARSIARHVWTTDSNPDVFQFRTPCARSKKPKVVYDYYTTLGIQHTYGLHGTGG